MLADLAGGNPRLRCISNHCAAFAHPAIRCAARDFHESHSAHALSLLEPAAQTEFSLGAMGAWLYRCCLDNVHYGAANMAGFASCSEGAESEQPLLGPHATRLHYTRLCPSLDRHPLGYKSLAQASGPVLPAPPIR